MGLGDGPVGDGADAGRTLAVKRAVGARSAALHVAEWQPRPTATKTGALGKADGSWNVKRRTLCPMTTGEYRNRIVRESSGLPGPVVSRAVDWRGYE